MKTKFFLAACLWAAGAVNPQGSSAGMLRERLSTCQNSCRSIVSECEFLNDIEVCSKNLLVCTQDCDARYPDLSSCLDECSSIVRFCKLEEQSPLEVCGFEKNACDLRCEHLTQRTLASKR